MELDEEKETPELLDAKLSYPEVPDFNNKPENLDFAMIANPTRKEQDRNSLKAGKIITSVNTVLRWSERRF